MGSRGLGFECMTPWSRSQTLVKRFVTWLRVFCGRWRWRGQFVREGNVARSSKTSDVGAVLVLDAEEGPHPASTDFREADEEA